MMEADGDGKYPGISKPEQVNHASNQVFLFL